MSQLQNAETPLLELSGAQGHRTACRLRSWERSLRRSRLSLTRRDRPRTFVLGGLEWDLFDEVFAPVYSPSTQVALDLLGLDPRQTSARRSGSFLEIGCGTGAVAVLAALAGCERVTASDISPQAVANAAANAERHGVGDRIRTLRSDIFSGIDEGERFDTVFWSSNYVLGPDSYEYRSVHERAFVDTGYRSHRRYVEQALRRITPGGTALLHFSDRGDVSALHRIADDCGRELRVLKSVPVHESQYGDDVVEHMLIEILPTTR
ncbi:MULTISPECIES: methyltransferase domain-containing protein [unclassified Streptomyces]|uniref:methyltransferase domain-containing protein n=1 Tax=unclassified Streptomyces TaxID=2593676 RepID=UPI001F544C3F|nr:MULTISPECIES: methyltransferase domain-containing protein [unclassified Streptomyces]